MADNIQEIPKQRGTSSGEIGQNPVEIRDKRRLPDGSMKNESVDADAKDEMEGDLSSGIED